MEDMIYIFIGICLAHIIFYGGLILIDFIKEILNKNK